MKKAFSFLIALAILMSSVLCLSSCKKDDGVPDGMQLVNGGDSLGYYFYGPEGWVIANMGDISCTYVSTIDYSSMTFTPLGVDKYYDSNVGPAAAIAELFQKDAEKFGREPFSDFRISKEGEPCSFGNAEEAYKFIYSYSYEGKPYTCMQIFSVYSGQVYIFTYNASSQEYSGEEKSFYQFYLSDYIQPAIDAFEFVEKQSDTDWHEYPRDGEGYILVSDKSICGFDLYVPDTYRVDYSSSIVSVSRTDGTNITVSELIDTSISIKDNYLYRKDKLTALADKVINDETGEYVSSFGEIKGVLKDENGKESLHTVELPNARSAAEFEYTYTLFGETYHVYQVFIVD